jgi:hypothetical protein
MYDTAYFDNMFRQTFGANPAVEAPGASGLDEMTRARLAAARAADSASVRTAAVQAAAPEVAPTVSSNASRAMGFGTRAAKAAGSMLNPNITAAGASRFAKGGLALAPIFGLLSAGTDSKDEVRNFADSIGLNYDSFGGRVGANTLNFLRKTGDAATFGAAGRLGRVLAGGSFFDEDPAKAAAPARPTGSGPMGLESGESVVSPAASPQQAAPDEQQQDPVAAALSGAMQFRPPQAPQPTVTARGPVEEYGGSITLPDGSKVDLPSGTSQRFGIRRPRLADNIDYAVERNAARADQNARVESAKLGVSMLMAGKRTAEEHIALGKLTAAKQWLNDHPSDYGGYAAILSGKDPKEVVGTIASPTGSTAAVSRDGKVVTFDVQGNPVEKTIYRAPTETEIAAMRANKTNASYKASFLKHFGPDAYKTHIENR